MAKNEYRAKRHVVLGRARNSCFASLKFYFLHGDGRFRFALPQEMGLRDWEARMTTEAWVLSQRERFKSHLHPLYLPLYLKVLRYMEATEAGRWWAPYSGFRDPEEQLKLYNKGRLAESKAKGERIVTNSLPGNSAHNYGCATDWAEFHPDYIGHEAWDKANWEFFQKAVQTCNMDWGGDWDRDGLSEPNEFDYPHCQLALRCPWKMIGDVYRAEGDIRAGEFIRIHTLTNELGERI